MNTTWERVEGVKSGFVAYLCYGSTLPVLETRRKPKTAEIVGNIMFDAIDETVNADDVIESERRIAYTVRLPYTEDMLTRRQERGETVPKWWRSVQVFDVGAMPKAVGG